MTSFGNLVAESCPTGVRFTPLGALGVRNKGTSITAARMKVLGTSGGPIRLFAGGQTVADVCADAIPENDVVRAPSIIVKSRGHIGFTYYNRPFSHKSELWSYSIDRPSVDQRFVYYYLLTQVGALQELARATSVKLPQLSVSDTDNLRIPVPPLEVQREIVRILDTFTGLEAELEAELEARRRQYEHYKARALTCPGPRAGWPERKLGELSDILVGFPFESSRFSTKQSDANLVRGDNIGQGVLKRHDFKRWARTISDGLGRYELRDGDVVLAMDRPWIPAGLKWARIDMSDLPALLVQRVARLRSRPEELDQRYLGHMISSARFTKHVLESQTGNTVPHISSATIAAFKLPLPPLTHQRKVADTLDKFDALVNDLSIGLPAELAARRKQYEYYRDKLLTFKELEA